MIYVFNFRNSKSRKKNFTLECFISTPPLGIVWDGRAHSWSSLLKHIHITAKIRLSHPASPEQFVEEKIGEDKVCSSPTENPGKTVKFCYIYGFNCTHSLTHSWSWAFLEQPPIVQLLKKFPAIYGTRRFIAVFTGALHWSLSWARSTPHHPILSL
jgi:hypothetical protein